MKEHFTDKELACPCCGAGRFNARARGMFNEAREVAGIPFVVNSACRCASHNAEVGGKPGSAHEFDEDDETTAMDIRARDSRARFLILAGLLAAGFTRIGVAKTFIHADADPDKDPRVVWLY